MSAQKYLLTIILFTIFMLTQNIFTQESQKVIKEQLFLVQPDGKLTIKMPAGKIIVNSWDTAGAFSAFGIGNELIVKIYGNDAAEKNFNFDINKAGNDIEVKGEKNSMQKEIGDDYEIRCEVSLPKQYNFNIEADTKCGNIKISGINGSVKTNTTGGNINIEHTDGDISANTMGGNIDIRTGTGKVDANTMGGNIKLDYSGINKGIELNTMGGNIHAVLPSDINGEADFSTPSGKISCDFAQPEKSFVSSFLKAKFNNGGEKISINTSAGNINVEKK